MVHAVLPALHVDFRRRLYGHRQFASLGGLFCVQSVHPRGRRSADSAHRVLRPDQRPAEQAHALEHALPEGRRRADRDQLLPVVVVLVEADRIADIVVERGHGLLPQPPVAEDEVGLQQDDLRRLAPERLFQLVVGVLDALRRNAAVVPGEAAAFPELHAPLQPRIDPEVVDRKAGPILEPLRRKAEARVQLLQQIIQPAQLLPHPRLRLFLRAGEELEPVDADEGPVRRLLHHDGRQHAALRLADGVGSFKREAVFEEQHADTDARDKADEAYQRVQITAAQTEHHPQRAAQKDQRADHDEHAQHESGRGGRARLRAELARCERHDERAQHQAQDLRAQILHLRGAVQAERARDVPLKAGDAEAHVGGVSQRGQRQGRDSDDDAGQNHEPVSFFHDILSFLFWHFAIFIIE